MHSDRKKILGLSLIALGGLVGGCFWAVSKLPIWVSIKKLWPDPWFKITVLDLYIGFGIVAGVVMRREKSVAKSALWIMLLAGLGNIATLLYIIIALSRLSNKQSFWEPKRDRWSFF